MARKKKKKDNLCQFVVFALRRMLERSHFCSLPATIAVFSTVVQEFNWSALIAREWENSKGACCHQLKPPALVEELEIINGRVEEDLLQCRLVHIKWYYCHAIALSSLMSFVMLIIMVITINFTDIKLFKETLKTFEKFFLIVSKSPERPTSTMSLSISKYFQTSQIFFLLFIYLKYIVLLLGTILLQIWCTGE